MIYLFHSFGFLVFFPLVFAIYWNIPKKYKNSLLLAASYIFFASWNWKFLGLLLISTYVDYFCGILIYNSGSHSRRKLFLLISIITNLSLLGFFKYFNFFIENLMYLLNLLGIPAHLSTLHIILPIGISFYTFQTMSYTIDIYRRKLEPTRNIIDFSLFVAYFPQLIAGPIERAKSLLPKIKAEKYFEAIEYKKGFYLFLYGLFKKIVIADNIGMIVDSIFSSSGATGAQVLMASYAFALQIYCDFSGYSNMARGISHLLGIKLSTNFRLPYLSTNPSDFWKRWHITLSSWVRDYIYIPLGGKHAGPLGLYALSITMVLMGLWHGASWNFVLWGFFWFIVIYIYRLLRPRFSHSPSILKKAASMLLMFHITCYSWIIFRSRSASQIILFTRSLFSIRLAEIISSEYYLLFFFGFALLSYEILLYIKKDQLIVPKGSFYYQLLFYFVLFFIYINVGAVSDARFLYFQF